MRITDQIIRTQIFFNYHMRRQKERWLTDTRGEFGMNSIIGVAIGLIIAAFVLIPSLQKFAKTVMAAMETWWSGTISGSLFPGPPPAQ